MNERNVKELIIETAKHKVTPRHIEHMRAFLVAYKPPDAHTAKKRFLGVYGKMPKMSSQQMLKQAWEYFLRAERFDYIVSNNTISMDQIVSIGFDKFAVTNGWRTIKDVKNWRRNKVRIGVCPHCEDQFIPLIFQVNFGLCKLCKTAFSSKAIRKYIDYAGSTDERYAGHEQDLLMNFFIMFYCDKNFRNLFIKEHPFAKKYEDFNFELSPSMKAAKRNMAARMGMSTDLEYEEVQHD